MRPRALVLLSITLAYGITGAAERDGSFDRSLTVSGPVDLDVQTDSGGIAVRPGAPGYLRVHAILKAQHGWFESSDVTSRIRQLERNPPVEQTGNHIQIGYVPDRDLLKGISMRVEIEAPPDTQVRARADSGGVRVEGIRGPADCHTDSGGIEIYDISSDVRAAADSGGIHLKNINGSAFAHVDSGGIDATQVAGTIDAQADSGGIRVGQTRPAPIRARADSGGVTVKLAFDPARAGREEERALLAVNDRAGCRLDRLRDREPVVPRMNTTVPYPVHERAQTDSTVQTLALGVKIGD